MQFDLAIRSKKILGPKGFVDGVVYISGGKIVSFASGEPASESGNIIDAGNNVVMPGLIDPHVHINEPGRTEWEGFETATKAAAAGGITTLIDMPLNSSPVTTSKQNLTLKISAAKKNAHVNCGFYGGMVPGNLKNIEGLLENGVFGIKAFLTHSGINEFPETSSAELRDVLLLLKKYERPLLVHCELSEDHEGIARLQADPRSYKAYLESRPRSWENRAISDMIKLCRETGAHVHIVHLSSSDALEEIKNARKEGLPLTVETAPHYLFFCAEEINDGATLWKCAPPIRERENNEKLWEALLDGTIDFIATDHSPAPPEMKETESGNFEKAWGGIAGLQYSLPVIWKAASDRNIGIEKVYQWMSVNPSKFLKLDTIKGKIEKNYDADLVIWNTESGMAIHQNDIYHRHKISPYSGLKLKGEILMTFVNGKVAFDMGSFPEMNSGEILSLLSV